MTLVISNSMGPWKKFESTIVRLKRRYEDTGSVICLTMKGRQLERNFEELKPCRLKVAIGWADFIIRRADDSCLLHGILHMRGSFISYSLGGLISIVMYNRWTDLLDGNIGLLLW